MLDPRIALSDHTKAIPKSCFYHIRALKHIRDSLDSSMIRTIAAALSPLGWIMQILSYTASLQNISLASSVFKILARVVGGSRSPNRTSNLATLSQLHWLPIHDRIIFKIATMTHKAIYTCNPPPISH